MDPEVGKEILKCFWIHCNTAYDAMIRTGGNQGITAGYGQLITLSGMGPGGVDLTNDLTYAMLEVIDEMSPILEPKPNVRLHRGSPDKLLDKVVEMIATSQGAPFLLNFDERSMAGLMLQAEKAGVQHLIHPGNVHDYAPVGCLENTMVGNDRSGTVDNNLNLLKAVELALTGGYDLIPFTDGMTGKTDPLTRFGPETGDPGTFTDFEQFWTAYAAQTASIIQKMVDTYEMSEAVRARYHPTPYLSCLVRGCAAQGKDMTEGGAELNFTTLEAVTYATTVDSLLAVKYLVFDKKACTMAQLVKALKDNWKGHEVLQAMALNKAPKYGRDDDAADAMAMRVMELWTELRLEAQDPLHEPPVPPRHAQLELLDRLFRHPARQPGWPRQGQVPFECPLPLQRRRFQRSDRQRQLGRQGPGHPRCRSCALCRLLQRAAQRRQPYHHLQPQHPA